MRNLVVVLLVLAVAGCCSMKKNCPMKNKDAMPMAAETMPAAVEAAAVEAPKAMEAAPEAVAAEVEKAAEEMPAVEVPVAK